jgi:putative transposase
VIYVDNGAAFSGKRLARCCAVLGARLTHSPPGEPAGRGKTERVFATVRCRFLAQIDHRGVADLAELDRLFSAWVEQSYHRRVHRETGQAPLERFGADGPPPAPNPARLREAFLWSECPRVTKTAQVSLLTNRYEVDPAVVGAVVELVFDPFDLTRSRCATRTGRWAWPPPFLLTRRVHPMAVAGQIPDEAARTGIDCLAMLDAEHIQATRRCINYTDLSTDDGCAGSAVTR